MRLYIDVGHGETGTDSGASAISGPTKYYENERNLRIARACADKLRIHGVEVTLSREQNVNHTRVGNYNAADSNIIASANKIKSELYDAMISIHCNDYSDSKARGYVIVQKNDDISDALADGIAYGLDYMYDGKQIPCNDINDNYTRYGILRLHNVPGALVEVGFMSNASDLHEILCNYTQIGDAIANGILYYLALNQKHNIDSVLYDIRERLNSAIDDAIEDAIDNIRDIIEEALDG